MKKKNGFTLVELLVTIALMLMVLGIAIVSIIKVSDARKQESYEQVKKQILTAAEQYLETNAYYKESITDTGNIKISLGLLVNEDYLNAVTNPITGKKLNECNYVEVTKKDSSLKYSFVDDQKDCSSNSYVDVSEAASAPKINATIIGKQGNIKDNNQYWYILDDQGNTPYIEITATDENSSLSTPIQIKNNSGEYANLDTEIEEEKQNSNYTKIKAYDYGSYATSTENKNVCYKVTNDNNVSSETCVQYSVDVDLPVCDFKITGIIKETGSLYNTYYQLGTIDLISVGPWLRLNASDEISGINEEKTKAISPSNNEYKYSGMIQSTGISIYDTNEKAVTWKANVFDNAGNQNTCSKQLRIDPYGLKDFFDKYEKTVTCGSTTGESTKWTNEDRRITQKFIIEQDGEEKTEDVSKTFKDSTKVGYVDLTVGLIKYSCPVNVYVDKEAPVITYQDGGRVKCKKSTNSSYYNSWGYSISYYDELSGATAYLTSYYSSSNCKSFYWANSGLSQKNASSAAKTFSVFAGCSNNTSPQAKFKVVDGAGNVSYANVTANTSNINSSNTNVCNSSSWYTSNR